MKIGYQGISGCHSQSAARQLAEIAGIYEPEYISLGSAENVVKALMKGSIDYGVVPVFGSAAGICKETEEALRDVRYMKVTALIMPIHECIFRQSGAAAVQDINKLASDALGLCSAKKAIKKYFPFARLIEEEDSAAAAEKLYAGEYDRYTAVICGRDAGISRGLSLMYENIEDDGSNKTVYYLISREPKETI